MTLEKWKEILSENDCPDILTDETYNEDYAHGISLTTKEIREIANMIQERKTALEMLESLYRKLDVLPIQRREQ